MAPASTNRSTTANTRPTCSSSDDSDGKEFWLLNDQACSHFYTHGKSNNLFVLTVYFLNDPAALCVYLYHKDALGQFCRSVNVHSAVSLPPAPSAVQIVQVRNPPHTVSLISMLYSYLIYTEKDIHMIKLTKQVNLVCLCVCVYVTFEVKTGYPTVTKLFKQCSKSFHMTIWERGRKRVIQSKRQNFSCITHTSLIKRPVQQCYVDSYWWNIEGL